MGTYGGWVENIRIRYTKFKISDSVKIEFQEVVSNSASNDQPLGTLAGRGINTTKKGGKLHIKVTEPCYIMGIVSITPRVDYCQGNDFNVYFTTYTNQH